MKSAHLVVTFVTLLPLYAQVVPDSSVATDWNKDFTEFVYVVNLGPVGPGFLGQTYDISGYWINGADGELTPMAGSPYPAGSNFLGDIGGNSQIAVDTTGRFLYAAGGEEFPDFLSYSIAGNGALTPLGTAGLGGIATTLAVDPKGRFLYLPGVWAFSLDPVSGAATPVPGSPFGPGVAPSAPAIDPYGRFLYTLGNGGVLAYQIDAGTGALTLIPASPFAVGQVPTGLVVDAKGRFVYVSNEYGGKGGDGTITAYEIDRHTGALKTVVGSPFTTGSGANPPVVEPTGRFLYVSLAGTSAIEAYGINPATGALTHISLYSTGTQPVAAAVDPSGRFIYTSNQNDGGPGTISAFSIDQRDGTLREVGGSPFATGPSSTSIAIGIRRRF